MPTQSKIKIEDAAQLRRELDALYEAAPKKTLAKWSLQLAKHIMEVAGFADVDNEIVLRGFRVNEAWQKGQARMHDVRQAGFAVHALAKGCGNAVDKAVLRVAGQAVGTGHMREHAMVASDYAVKVINLLRPGDADAVTEERKWQVNSLRGCL